MGKVAALTGALAIGLTACSANVDTDRTAAAQSVAPEATATAPAVADSSPQTTEGGLPSGPGSYGAIAIGMNGTAHGDVTDAEVPVVDVYVDFACYYCMLFESGVAPDLEELAMAGEAIVVYHPVAILDRKFPSQYSTRAAAAAMVVAEETPEAFVEYTMALMTSQESLPEDGWTEGELADFALDLGAPQEAADAIVATDFEDVVGEATAQAYAGGMQGTPSVAVNGVLLDYEQINYIEPGVLVDYLASM